MGYYTEFTLEIKTDINKDLIGDGSTEKRIADYIKSLGEDTYMDQFLEDGEFSSGNSMNGKWYDHEEDMRALSLAVQDVLFELTGEGEEWDDRWRQYFLNGKAQECRARVTCVYPEFDMGKLK